MMIFKDMKNRYMKSIEFKTRQLRLDFECAASIALRVVADSIDDFRKWFKKWNVKVKQEKPVNKSKWLWVELKMLQANLRLER